MNTTLVGKTKVLNCKYPGVRLQKFYKFGCTVDVDLTEILRVLSEPSDGLKIAIAEPKSNDGKWKHLKNFIYPKSQLESLKEIFLVKELIELQKLGLPNERIRQLQNELVDSRVIHYKRKYVVKLDANELLQSDPKLKAIFFD